MGQFEEFCKRKDEAAWDAMMNINQTGQMGTAMDRADMAQGNMSGSEQGQTKRATGWLLQMVQKMLGSDPVAMTRFGKYVLGMARQGQGQQAPGGEQAV